MKDTPFTEARLLSLYDRVAEAEDAIPRLRRFVLDLAVRGKLVPQEAGDEPASVLLERIEKEKARLVKAGAYRSGKMREVEAAVVPDILPQTWAWVALGNLFIYDAGEKRDPGRLVRDMWLLELEDVEKDTGRVLTRLPVSARESLSTKSEFQIGDILYGKLRPYLNKVVVADEAGYSTTEIVAIRPYLPMCSEYCALALRRPDFVDYVTRLGQGTKMPRLRTEDALVSPFPLPPLAEQHRIVAKVEELMALLDRLEAARAAREETRTRLTAATLSRLTDTDTPTAARFALQTLPALTTRPDQIKTLRQTILNLAVRGKLVAQDPTDEPAADLLKRIGREIAAYSKSERITHTLPASVEASDKEFDLPKGWSWTRLCGLFKVITDGDHQPPPKAHDGIAFLTIGNVTTGKLDFAGCRTVPAAYFEALPRYRTPRKGDILYTVVGATYGRPALVETDRPFCVQRHIAIMKPSEAMDLRFLLHLLASPMVYDQATKGTTGTAQPTIALRPLRNFVIALPPLAEQHRIVAKVEELMSFCDRLEHALQDTTTTRARLLEATLRDALTGAQEAA